VAVVLSVCEVLLKFPLYPVPDGALLFTTASTTVLCYLSKYFLEKFCVPGEIC